MAKDENKESEIRGDEQEIVDQRLPVWRPQDADREYYRYETKKRIQHYTVPPQTISVQQNQRLPFEMQSISVLQFMPV